jgi:hypothetical protein
MVYSTERLDENEYVEVAENYYVRHEELKTKSSRELHLDMCRCVAERYPGIVFTGQSACAIYGIPRLDPYDMQVHCIWPYDSAPKQGTHTQRHSRHARSGKNRRKNKL